MFHPIDASAQGIAENMLDLLDLYTHHRTSTIVGQRYSLEAFIAIRITLNQEASAENFARYTMGKKKKNEDENGATATNGIQYPRAKNEDTPMTSPQDDLTKDITSPTTGASKLGSKEGTVRFMLNPQRAKDEKDAVAEYFKFEEEEYEIEVERRRRP